MYIWMCMYILYKCGQWTKNACSQSFPHKLHDVVMIRVNEQEASEWLCVQYVCVHILYICVHECSCDMDARQMKLKVKCLWVEGTVCVYSLLPLLPVSLFYFFCFIVAVFFFIFFFFCLMLLFSSFFPTESRVSVVIWCVPQRNVYIHYVGIALYAHFNTCFSWGVLIHSLTCCKYRIIDLAIST